jgi:hypothetical protein
VFEKRLMRRIFSLKRVTRWFEIFAEELLD